MKMYEFQLKLTGQIDGSVLAAINQARNALKGLNRSEREGLNGRTTNLQNRLQGLNRLQKAMQEYVRMNQQLQQGQTGKGQLQKMMLLGRELNEAGYGVNRLVSSMMRLNQAAKEANAELHRIAETTKRLSEARDQSRNATNDLNNAWENMSNAVTTAQSIMSPITSSVETAKSFEAAVSKSKALTQMDNIRFGNTEAMEREMKALTERYLEIGRTTTFTATQAAEAGNYLAMAGWKAPEIDQGLGSVVNLAMASGSGVERAADILSNIQTAFGMGKTQADIQHLADVLTYTVTHSNQDLSQLGDTMKYAAPIAKMFGSKVEETAAMTKFLADAGIQGSMAGTSLRATMLRLVAPPKKASKAMQENGITVDDAQKAWVNAQETAAEYGITLEQTTTPGKQMVSIIKQIDEKMSGLSAHEKMAAFSAITGINAVSGALNLFEAGAPALEEFTRALEMSSEGQGAAAQTAGVMADNLQGSMISMESALEGVKIAAGNAFLPALKSIADSVTPVIRSIAEFASENPALVQGLGLIATTAAGTVLALGGFRLALAGINFVSTSIELMKATAAFQTLAGGAAGATGILATFGKIIAAFKAGGLISGLTAIGTAARAALAALGPVGWAVMALGTLAAVLMANWDAVGPYFEGLWTKVKGIFQSAYEGIKPLIDAIKGAFAEEEAAAQRTAMKSDLTMGVRQAIEMDETSLDEVTRSTRSILRASRGESSEEVAEKLWQRLAGENQTNESQIQMLSMLKEELGSRQEYTTEQQSAILAAIKEHMVENKKDTSESVIAKLEGYAAKVDMSVEANRETFAATAKEVLSNQSGLNETQRAAIFNEVMTKIDDRNRGAQLGQELTAALSEMKLDSLSEQMAAVDKAVELSGKSGASFEEQLKAFEGWMKSQTALTETMRTEMLASYKERSEEAGTAKREAIKEDATLRWESQSTAAPEMASEKYTAMQTALNMRPWEMANTAPLQPNELGSAMWSGLSDMLTNLFNNREQNAELTGAIKEALTASKLGQRDETVANLAQLINQQSNKDAALTAAIEQIQALKEVSDASKTDMIAQLKEALSTEKTAEKSALSEATKAMPQATRGLEGSSKSLGTAANALRAAAEKLKGAKAPSEGVNAQSNPELSMRVQETVRALPRGTETVVDNSQLQASTLALSTSINEAALAQTAVTSNLSMTTAAFGSTLMMAGSNVGMAFSTVSMQAQTAGAGINQLGFTSIGATGSINGLGAASAGAQSGMAGLGAASAGASGSISGLGSAAISAISALMSAASSAGSAIAGAVSAAASGVAGFFGGGNVAHNAVGGIYPRGEFLTTFAETSPEAAIPIDGSRRAKGLWLQTGRMLGMFPKQRSIISQQDADAIQKAEKEKASGAKPKRKNFIEKTWEAIIHSPIWGGLKMPSIPGRPNIPSNTPRGSRRDQTLVMPGLPIGTPLSMPMMQAGQLETRMNTFDALDRSAQSFNAQTTTNNSSSPITLNFTFNGNVDKEGVKAGVREMLPTFEEQLMRFRHEERRRSF